MIFNTWSFALFAVVTLTAYWTAVPRRLRPHALVVAGAVFYACAVPAYLLVIATLATITYVASATMLRTRRARRGPILASAVAIVVGTLVFFKYAHLFAAIVDGVARSHVVPLPSLVVPLAISFFTFEFVHVLADVAKGKIRSLDPLEFATFALFFPTLVAGPIKRYETFVPQLRDLAPPSRTTAMLDTYRIMLGLAKKTIVADSMTAFIGPLSTPGAPYGRADYAIAVVAYAMKIYFDFSGYCDIAIGLGGLLGFAIPENFDMPYRAPNVAEFWRRWHVSLSSWIRDYVFVPLGGSRGTEIATARNLSIAMALAGLWHGAAATFVLWGLWHGFGLVAHRWWRRNVVARVAYLRAPSLPVRAVSVATTFAFVSLGWILFAAPTPETALAVVRGLLF